MTRQRRIAIVVTGLLAMSAASAGCAHPATGRNLQPDVMVLVEPHLTTVRGIQSIVKVKSAADVVRFEATPYVGQSDGSFAAISRSTGLPTTPEDPDRLQLVLAAPDVRFDRPIALGRLKARTTYRIFAKAYDAAGALISTLDSNSYADLAVGIDDRPVIKTLPVKLIDSPFGANGEVNLAVAGSSFERLSLDLLASVDGTDVAVAQVASVAKDAVPDKVALANLRADTTYRLKATATDAAGRVVDSRSVTLQVANDEALKSASLSLAPGFQIQTIAGILRPLAGARAADWAMGAISGIAVDVGGNTYFSEATRNAVRMVSSDGTLRTIAGTGFAGFGGDSGPATAATLNSPQGLALDSSGALFIADTGNNCVRRVAADGTITTVAGTTVAGFSGDGGPARQARLWYPQAVAIGSAGVYVADTNNNRIRKIDGNGVITTIAGNGANGYAGDDGNALTAAVGNPQDLAVDAAGNVFILARDNHRIRKVTPAGIISVAAGTGLGDFSGDGKSATSAYLHSPAGIAADRDGNLYIPDQGNNRIRKIGANGVITTIAGTGATGFSGDGGPAGEALLDAPANIATAGGAIYFGAGRRIRRIAVGGKIETIAGAGVTSFSGDGAAANRSQLAGSAGVAADAQGNVYIADTYNNRVRRIGADGRIVTIAGTGAAGFSGDGGPAAGASFQLPTGIAVSRAGVVYVSDSGNHRVRAIGSDGIIRTVAGDGTAGYAGDGGPATAARLASPAGLALDAAGNLYVADSLNDRIRLIGTGGKIGTVSMSGQGSLNTPLAVAIDAANNLYVADTYKSRVLKRDAAGTVTRFAGSGNEGFAGDGSPAAGASLLEPSGVAVDRSGDVYISDTGNNRVRLVAKTGIITTIAGAGQTGSDADEGPALMAGLSSPAGLAADDRGRIYVADTGAGKVRVVE